MPMLSPFIGKTLLLQCLSHIVSLRHKEIKGFVRQAAVPQVGPCRWRRRAEGGYWPWFLGWRGGKASCASMSGTCMWHPDAGVLGNIAARTSCIGAIGVLKVFTTEKRDAAPVYLVLLDRSRSLRAREQGCNEQVSAYIILIRDLTAD